MPQASAESIYLVHARNRLRDVLRRVHDRRLCRWLVGAWRLPARRQRSRPGSGRPIVSLRRDRGGCVASYCARDIPRPARLLEFVVYRLDTASSGLAEPDFELNLNTGEGLPLSVQSRGETGDLGSHWYAIDRSVLSQAGIALVGPPAGEVFASIPPRDLIPVLTESLRWHRDHATEPSDAVLNACRALRYAEEAGWSSKPAAGRWAVGLGLAPGELIQARASSSHRGKRARSHAGRELSNFSRGPPPSECASTVAITPGRVHTRCSGPGLGASWEP